MATFTDDGLLSEAAGLAIIGELGGVVANDPVALGVSIGLTDEQANSDTWRELICELREDHRTGESGHFMVRKIKRVKL